MAMTISRQALEDCAVLVVIHQDGIYEYSSDKTPAETANALDAIAAGIRQTNDIEQDS